MHLMLEQELQEEEDKQDDVEDEQELDVLKEDCEDVP